MLLCVALSLCVRFGSVRDSSLFVLVDLAMSGSELSQRSVLLERYRRILGCPGCPLLHLGPCVPHVQFGPLVVSRGTILLPAVVTDVSGGVRVARDCRDGLPHLVLGRFEAGCGWEEYEHSRSRFWSITPDSGLVPVRSNVDRGRSDVSDRVDVLELVDGVSDGVDLACGRRGPVAAEVDFGSCRCMLVGGEALSVFRAVQKHLVAQSLWSIFLLISDCLV